MINENKDKNDDIDIEFKDKIAIDKSAKDNESIKGSGCEILIPKGEFTSILDIEKSITKKYKKTIWAKFIKALKDYNLVEEGDKIAIAISGGKDSLLLAKLFQELKKHKKVNFEVEFICMDPGYHRHIRELLEENVKKLNIDLTIFDSQVFDVIDDIAKDYPCYMCARMRRGYLYSKARELGCNKLALGHHFNDVIETVLLNIIYGGSFKAMPPKLRSTNYREIELIRPLYYVEEKYIKKWISDAGIMPLNCACMVAAKKTGNKRYEIRDLIENLKKINKDVDKAILKSTQNVHMDTLLGAIKGKDKFEFNDLYKDRFYGEDED